jgi:hypothetical protein
MSEIIVIRKKKNPFLFLIIVDDSSERERLDSYSSSHSSFSFLSNEIE